MRLSNFKLGNEQYPALTGVRAIAAFMVFFAHFQFHTSINIITAFQKSMFIGVGLFFVLSGFLIVFLYYNQLNRNSELMAKYLFNRIARIYPLYFLVLTIVVFIKHDFRTIFLIKNYTLTHSLFTAQSVAIPPTWTLTVEECFYFSAPIIIFLARRYSIVVPFLICCALSLIALVIANLGLPFLANAAFIFMRTFFGYFFDFFAGAYLAIWMLAKKESYPKSYSGSTFVGLAGIISVMAAFAYFNQDSMNAVLYVCINSFILPCFVTIFYFGLLNERTFITSLLSTKVLNILGKSSYAFYLIHFPIITYVARPFLLHHLGYNLSVICTFIITTILSLFLYVYFEAPANKFLRSRFNKRFVFNDSRA